MEGDVGPDALLPVDDAAPHEVAHGPCLRCRPGSWTAVVRAAWVAGRGAAAAEPVAVVPIEVRADGPAPWRRLAVLAPRAVGRAAQVVRQAIRVDHEDDPGPPFVHQLRHPLPQTRALTVLAGEQVQDVDGHLRAEMFPRMVQAVEEDLRLALVGARLVSLPRPPRARGPRGSGRWRRAARCPGVPPRPAGCARPSPGTSGSRRPVRGSRSPHAQR